MEYNEELLQIRIKQGALVPGKLTEMQFYLLTEMSSIRSESMIQALMEYLVHGKSRIVACDENGVGSSHFSISLERLQRLSRLVAQLSVYYQ
ncbi:PapB/FocB family fimbrial expression transcriptional regulator [Yersinia enterocolitica]|uniref:PapB/FocB family fimbrial expression transcriptional regulator n=1 Tax=Yersinia enterocolitica TaxID=630 RepID=UPI0029B1F1F0|nr:transcriptional regulator [Yersinia enterocolitica]HEI6740025.1 transcriptional regulator [Yersinia enterocolitica]HEI6857285.1 transcriptional regulator [Yersinia enterocolitica]